MRPDFFDWHLTEKVPFVLERHRIHAGKSCFLDFHRSIHLLFITSGEYELEIGRYPIYPQAGCLITAPWELHGNPQSRCGCWLLMTALRPESLYNAILWESEKLKSILMLPPGIRHSLLLDCHCDVAVRACMEILEKARTALEQWHALVGFFIQLVTLIPTDAIPAEQQQSIQFELVPAFKELYACRGRRFSAEDGAKACSMSVSRFRTCFREATGIPFAEYELQFRLNLALELIDKKTVIIKDIAEELGFGDVCHFSNSFKKYFGISPKQYIGKTQV